jgi:hypothetical protein
MAEAERRLGKPTYSDQHGFAFGRPILAWVQVRHGQIVTVSGGGVRRDGRVLFRGRITPHDVHLRLGQPENGPPPKPPVAGNPLHSGEYG